MKTVVYLIRWKVCWTAESHIDDFAWAQAFYEAQNLVLKRRCSTRIKKTAEARVAKRDGIIVVIRLEDPLRL